MTGSGGPGGTVPSPPRSWIRPGPGGDPDDRTAYIDIDGEVSNGVAELWSSPLSPALVWRRADATPAEIHMHHRTMFDIVHAADPFHGYPEFDYEGGPALHLLKHFRDERSRTLSTNTGIARKDLRMALQAFLAEAVDAAEYVVSGRPRAGEERTDQNRWRNRAARTLVVPVRRTASGGQRRLRVRTKKWKMVFPLKDVIGSSPYLVIEMNLKPPHWNVAEAANGPRSDDKRWIVGSVMRLYRSRLGKFDRRWSREHDDNFLLATLPDLSMESFRREVLGDWAVNTPPAPAGGNETNVSTMGRLNAAGTIERRMTRRGPFASVEIITNAGGLVEAYVREANRDGSLILEREVRPSDPVTRPTPSSRIWELSAVNPPA